MVALTVTKEQLDASGCSSPNCNHDHSTLYIHAVCHISSAVCVKYEKKTGLIIVECAECDKEVIRIKL
jgi:hypothetical protein